MLLDWLCYQFVRWFPVWKLKERIAAIEHLEGDRPARSAEIVPLIRKGGH